VIIGLQGYAGSGKSTVADYLAKRHGFARRHIKQPIADMVASLIADAVPMGFDDDIYRYLDGDLKRTPIAALGNRTPTEIQQFLGRNFIHPDIWLDIWSAWAAGHERVVQESVRFANEAERCDVIWEVRRPGYEALNAHVSEALPAKPDVILDNSGGLEGLYDTVDRILAGYAL
jgi:dephospho-CoA kinase